MHKGDTYKVIVIGGSLGGFEAIVKILSHLPASYPIPIVIVLHRLRNTKSTLPELVNGKVDIKVKEADEKEVLQPGTAYISPANYHILLEKEGTISLDASELVNYSRPSIDILFESATEAFIDKVIGVILTGANSDGSHGLQSICQAGGMTIVQDPTTAASDTMPKAALKVCNADYILPLDGIGALLKKIGEAV